MKNTITMRDFDDAVWRLKRHRPNPDHGPFHIAVSHPVSPRYVREDWDR